MKKKTFPKKIIIANYFHIFININNPAYPSSHQVSSMIEGSLYWIFFSRIHSIQKYVHRDPF